MKFGQNQTMQIFRNASKRLIWEKNTLYNTCYSCTNAIEMVLFYAFVTDIGQLCEIYFI